MLFADVKGGLHDFQEVWPDEGGEHDNSHCNIIALDKPHSGAPSAESFLMTVCTFHRRKYVQAGSNIAQGGLPLYAYA